MAITITTDTVVKIIVRNGTDSQRKTNVIFSQGELGYTTDTTRLFVGDGITLGGNPVGVRNFNYVPSGRNSVTSPQVGDIVLDFDASKVQTLYTYTSANTWSPAANYFQADNNTLKNNNGIWSVNTLLLSSGVASIASAINLISTTSGYWNTTTQIVTAVNPSSILANTDTVKTGKATSVPLLNNQIVGLGSNVPASVVRGMNLSGSNGITIGSDPYNFIIDGSPLQSQITTLSSSVYNAQYDINDIGTTFYKETSFVYGVDCSKGTAGFSNMWQNVMADSGSNPLRVSVTTGSRPRMVYVEGRLFVRMGANATTNWARLGTFTTTTPSAFDQLSWTNVTGSFPLLSPPYRAYTTATRPLSVLDVAAWEGIPSYSQGQEVYLRSYYYMPANTTTVFGLQTFLFATPGNGWFELNGWQTGAAKYGQDGPRNEFGFTSSATAGSPPNYLPNYKGIYAWGQDPVSQNGTYFYNGAPGSSAAYPQTNPGIHNNNTTAATLFADMQNLYDNNGNIIQQNSWGVKNVSYIRAVFIG